MEHSRKQMRFEILIDRYISNFLRIVLTNLLFFIPLAVVSAVYLVLNRYLNEVTQILIAAVLIALIFPFFAGVVYVCRNMARGDKDVKVVPEFIKGIKENFKQFLFMGFLFAVVTVFSYFSLSLYTTMLSSSWIYYVLLFVCIIISLCVLFMLFYAPVMACTFDLSFKNIIRNSFLMSFGELKNNFKALFSLLLIILLALTATAFSGSVLVLAIILSVVFAFFLPASCQFVTCFYVYDDMYATIADNSTKLGQIESAIELQKDKRNTSAEPVVEDYSDVDISTLKDTDDYIFYNGKMMKQSVLLKLALEQRQNEQEDNNG